MPVTTLTITDLTRMGGNRVCIAGVTEDGENVRPEFDHHAVINEDWLFDNHLPMVKPIARIQFDLLEHRPANPHSEDWIVRQDFKRFERNLSEAERRTLLERVNDGRVDAIFGAEIHHDFGSYIAEGEGNRSLGTVCVSDFDSFEHTFSFNKWDYRIRFSDQTGTYHRLAVTDLAFRYYVNFLREKKNYSLENLSEGLTVYFKTRTVYLRIGLARPTWIEHPHCCFLQINGVYTFPDYLKGRCFADFRPDLN